MKVFLKKVYRRMKFFLKLLALSPGIVVHETAHAFFCLLTGTKVFKIKFFQFDEVAGYVEHEKPKSLVSAFLVSFGPLFLNTVVSFFLFLKVGFDGSDWFVVFSDWRSFLFLYLAVSVALSAIPSDQDGESFGRYVKDRVKKNILFFPIVVFYPLVWFLNLANYLKKFKIDYFFTAGIFYFAVVFG